jgi:hypothetical protein
VQVSLVAYLSAGAFLGLAYFDYFYNLVLIVAVGRVVLTRTLAVSSETKPGERDATGVPQPQTPAGRTVASAGSFMR